MSNPEVRISETRYSESQVVELKLIPGITNRITLHRKRKAQQIGYYRIGNKVFYGQSHIEEFLKRCERKPKAMGGAR